LISKFSILHSQFSRPRLQNEPNFFAANYGFLHQKRRNGGQKLTKKNETNPFVDNFACPLNAERYTLIPMSGGTKKASHIGLPF
jgi:hypothetical protein